MDKSTSNRNMSVNWQECLAEKIPKEDFPDWFYATLMDASNAISVSHEGLYHYLVSTVNYAMLHADVHLDSMEWKEPVLIWNLIISVSGSRKTLIYKTFTQLMNDAIDMLEKNDNVKINQWTFQEGSVERIGLSMSENFGKMSFMKDEAARILNLSSNGNSNKTSKEGQQDMLILDTYNGSRLQHQTVTGTNYRIERSGLLVGGFTQPEIGIGLLKVIYCKLNYVITILMMYV